MHETKIMLNDASEFCFTFLYRLIKIESKCNFEITFYDFET